MAKLGFGIFLFCFFRFLKQRMGFNDSFEICDSHNMKLLTNKDVASYDQILTMENFNKVGRKMLWIGAQKKLKEKWIWADYHSPEWPWNGQEVQVQPWGLQEPRDKSFTSLMAELCRYINRCFV